MSDRRPLDWTKIRGSGAWAAVGIGTFFGSGLLPKMPGTWGTIAAMPLCYFLAPEPIALKLGVWTVLTVAGTWAGKKFQDLFGVADNQNIVMDEVVGVGLTSLFLARESDWYWWLAAFAFFRLFDIVKLPPVGAIDRWSKTPATAGVAPAGRDSWRGGFGVMADDLAAGIQGLIVVEVFRFYFA